MGRGAWWATVRGVAKSQTWLNDWASTPYLRVDSRNEVMHEVIPGSCAFYLECAFPNHPTFKITTHTIHYHKIVLFTLKNKPVCQHVPCGSSGVIFRGEMSKTWESEDKSALSSATGSLTAFASHLSSFSFFTWKIRVELALSNSQGYCKTLNFKSR